MHFNTARTILLFFLISLAAIGSLSADTVYLKNGRSLTGIITGEDEHGLELDLGYGSVKFEKSQVERIYKAKPEEIKDIKKEQADKKIINEQRWTREESERKQAATSDKQEQTSKKVADEGKDGKEGSERKQEAPTKESGHVEVTAMLNDKVKAELILDTGASYIVLSSEIVKKLGLDMQKEGKDAETTVADGRKVKSKYFILKSVSVEDVTVKDVEAVMFLDEKENLSVKDGLLGLSFLNKFNYKIDNKNKKLILEKLE